jgi:hypothetical protein
MKTKIIVSMCFIFFILSFNAYAITPTEWVDAHNKYRRRHVDTPDVVWDSALAAKAQKCANMKPGTKPLAGGWHCNYGENWAGSTSSAETVVGSFWYDEIEDYDYNNPGFSQDTGHFTQVVWKSSTKIGCATGYGSVCLYEPYGNWNGAYSGNVKPLKPMGSNILWYHNWGFIGLWYMNGANYASSAWIGYANPSWQVAGAADFDKNGSTDILWRNYTTGENVVWKMAGIKIESQVPLEKKSDVNWKIAGTGDFNGDGLTDILWRHATKFDTLVWLMDGVKRISISYLPKSVHPDWKIVGTGDFNGDYTTDILWRNTGNGSNAVWYLEKGKYFFLQFIEGAKLDWEVGATGDLNKDAKTDILWRNTKTGANAVWYANAVWSAKDGADNFSTKASLPPVTDLNFKMVGTGIFK